MGTIQDRYDASAARYRQWWEPVLAPTALRLLDSTPPRIDGSGALRVLDLGTGAGLLAIEAVGRWPDATVTGLDASSGMLGIAERAAADRLTVQDRGRLQFVAGDAARLPFPDSTFDLVVSSFMLQLVADRPAVFAEVHRVLQPGGRFASVTWLATGEDERFAPDEAFEDALDDIEYDDGEAEAEEERSGDFLSADEAAAELGQAGFEEVDAVATELVHPYDPATYLDFLAEYAEFEVFEDLSAARRGRLREATADRLAGLPVAAFTWRVPVVEAHGRRG
jgi:ubiquinone/menaquinone biosynthesis C-methylase UbiE